MAKDVERAATAPEVTVGVVERGHHASMYGVAILNQDYEGKPTEEEMATLRRVPGPMPLTAMMLCAIEFCERASYYGCVLIFSNYINRPLPTDGNGYGAPPRGSQQTAGGLGMGEATANAVVQSFNVLCYCLPLLFGYIADSRTGRWPMIFWGVVLCGIGHAIMCAGGAKTLLADGSARIPFFIGTYILAIGAAMFKPNVSPLLLDQMTTHVPKVMTQKSGERVIQDPEHSTERIMLWFYLLINVGAFMAVPTSYIEKYYGWWLAFLLPLVLYLPLPLLLLFLRKRLILHPPGGSDLPNVLRVLGYCIRGGGIFRIGHHGWWNAAKPSVIAARGMPEETRWNDQFVEDVRRTFQATGMFCFFPVQTWNDQGIGSAALYLSTMLTTNGVPNDLISNWNSLSIIVVGPILNYGLYPLLRRLRVHYGPVARVTTAFFISTLAGVGYCVICIKAYQTSPCGWYGSSDPKCVDQGLVSPISIWWMAIPYSLGGISELFINVPAYGIAYSRASVNMRGFVSAINLLNSGFSYIVNLACSAAIVDPHLVWDFGGPAILGFFTMIVFYAMFRHIDKEQYVLSTNAIDAAHEADSDTNLTGESGFLAEKTMN